MANYNDDKLPRLTCDYRTISRVQTPNYVTHTIEPLTMIENMPLREKSERNKPTWHRAGLLLGWPAVSDRWLP